MRSRWLTHMQMRSALAYHETLCCDGRLAGRDAVHRFVGHDMQQLTVHRCRDCRLTSADIAAACQCCCLLYLRFLQDIRRPHLFRADMM